jgi:hypothetical protein
MKSGKFNFLEPSGPLQACNGTALPCFNATYLLMSIRGKLKEKKHSDDLEIDVGNIESDIKGTG